MKSLKLFSRYSITYFMRQNISTGSTWESEVGYSRLVKSGHLIFVSGTTSVDEEGNIVGLGDSYEQTKYVIQKIHMVLRKVNANLSDITRTRIFTTRIDDWRHIGRAHAEYFKEIRPVTTMIEVKRLIQPELLVEIEVDAVLTETDNNKQCS
ncbi:MAG: RidA family protein [Candidatus Nitrosocosmicus sp.]|nr:RidA family protein [Candidatus Nitrosocosmicus sp.]